MNTIEVRELSKSYGSVTALNNVSFTVPEGHIVGFLGPNGAGKTTTIGIIMQFINADYGQVQLFGEIIETHKTYPSLNKRIGLIPDAELPNIVASRFLKHTALYNGLAGQQLAGRIQEVVHMLGADSFVSRNTKTMSKGQRQRIKIANALIHDPELIIADEPSAGLDPLSRKSLLQLFESLSKDQGKTVFFSNHVISEVERISDKIVVLSNGRIAVEGSINEIVEKLPVSNIFEIEGNGITSELLMGLDSVELVDAHPNGRFSVKIKEQNDHTPKFIIQLVSNPEIKINSFVRKQLELEDIFFAEVTE